MRKFLLYRIEKNKEPDLVSVLYGTTLNNVTGQINKEIQRDLLFLPGMKRY